jgi:hypothetical protein
MSMTQLVLGCALGFLVAQGVLWALARMLGRAPRAAAVDAEEKSIPSSYIRAFIRYAAPVGASAAFVLLGAWTLQDYLSAKSARAAAESIDPPVAAAEAPPPALDSAAPAVDADAAEPPRPDPYADTEFKVVHHPHPGQPLRDRLMQQAELKARWELLAELRARAQRSQYDCEATDRADRYLKAGLDVWGFTTWQAKHFPVDDYQGATLPQCQGLQSLVDPARVNLKSTVAQRAQDAHS